MLATVAFDANDIQSKNNLKLTIPTDVQLIFRDSILRYSGKCSQEIQQYLKQCGWDFLTICHKKQ